MSIQRRRAAPGRTAAGNSRQTADGFPRRAIVDYYVTDPDLEQIITDADALRAALVEGPILVAGNKLVN